MQFGGRYGFGSVSVRIRCICETALILGQRQFTETLLSLFIKCSVPGVELIVSIPDIFLLPYFLYSHEYRLTRNTVNCAILSDQIMVGCPLGVPITY